MFKTVLITVLSTLIPALSLATENCQNSWLKVLVAQTTPPPNNADGYIRAIHTLAPNLEQLHLRILAGSDAANLEQFEELIVKLRSTYPNLLIGFHPDTSKGSESHWGCATGDWQCTFGKSLAFMNLVNSNLANRGFDIYSLEQEGYVEDFSPEGIALMKSCLIPSQAKAGVKCPENIPYAIPGKLAIKGVKFGLVATSYLGAEYYGPSMLDYNYPETYNIYYNLGELDITGLCLSSSTCNSPDKKPYFDPSTTTGININKPIVAVDADLRNSFKNKQVIPIKVGQEGPTGFTVYSPANPVTAAQYFSFISGKKFLNPTPYGIASATVYPALSGEASYPTFLGGSGWTNNKLCQFNQSVIENYKTLKNKGLLLPDNNKIDFDSMGFAIWNFYQILKNTCPACGL